MNQPTDDLEAVRAIVATLEPFEIEDRERIMRWVCEKLRIDITLLRPAHTPADVQQHPTDIQKTGVCKDIKSFIAAKDPKADIHFAATVAYYFKFEAKEAEQKPSIRGSDLQEACRQAGRKHLPDLGHTLRDAHRAGLLDKCQERGTYKTLSEIMLYCTHATL